MLKSILAIIVSYVAGISLFFALVAGAFFLLGVERVFEPFSYEISGAWLVLTLVGSLLSATLAGYICALIGKSSRTCQILAFVVFFLTLTSCVLDLRRIDPDAPNTRAGEIGYFDAMKLAVTPRWLVFVNPVVSGIGVLLGARMRRRG
ncbi:MAG TPA: hypothetical protein VIM09_02860 [Chthoniobacterales bacterium]|jgi:hypothetical protein